MDEQEIKDSLNFNKIYLEVGCIAYACSELQSSSFNDVDELEKWITDVQTSLKEVISLRGKIKKKAGVK